MDFNALKVAAKEQLGGNVMMLAVYTLIFSIAGGIVSVIIPPFSGFIWTWVISPMVTAGFVGMYLNMTKGQSPDISDLWMHSGNILTCCLISFFISVLTFLWSLLFLIPGIIKGFSYSMAFFVFNDHPDWTPKECIDESKRIMNGHKMNLFLLQVSFIGWYLLGIVTCGLAFIYISPLLSVTIANFYNVIKDA